MCLARPAWLTWLVQHITSLGPAVCNWEVPTQGFSPASRGPWPPFYQCGWPPPPADTLCDSSRLAQSLSICSQSPGAPRCHQYQESVLDWAPASWCADRAAKGSPLSLSSGPPWLYSLAAVHPQGTAEMCSCQLCSHEPSASQLVQSDSGDLWLDCCSAQPRCLGP